MQSCSLPATQLDLSWSVFYLPAWWYLLYHPGPVVASESGQAGLTLLTSNNCGTCIGHQLVYECTTIGPGSTVWTGTVFHCRSKSIVLSHSLFNMPGGTEGSCNNGDRVIVGHSRRAASINNSYAYTSQLNVTVDASMSGETVKCVYNDGASENAIGNNTVVIREGNWNTMTVNCSFVHKIQ